MRRGRNISAKYLRACEEGARGESERARAHSASSFVSDGFSVGFGGGGFGGGGGRATGFAGSVPFGGGAGGAAFPPSAVFADGIRIGVPGAGGAAPTLPWTKSQQSFSQSRHVMFAWKGLSSTRLAVD